MTRGLLQLYQGLWRYSGGARGALCGAFILLGASETIKLAMPWLSGRAIDTLQRMGWSGIDQVAWLVAAVLGCLLASWLMHGPGRILERNVALKVRAAYVGKMTDHILDAPLAWHRERHSVEIAQLLTQSSEALSAFAQNQYLYLQKTISLIGPMIALYWISPWVGIAALIGYALLGIISVAFDRALLRIHSEQVRVERRYFTALADTLASMLTIFALRKRAGMSARLSQKLDDTFASERKEFIVNEFRWAAIEIFAAALVYIEVGLYVWLQGNDLTVKGGIALGGVFMIYEYAKRIDNVVSVMVGQFAQLNHYIVGFNTGRALTSIECETRIDNLTETAPAWRRIDIRALGYRYAGCASPVLHNLHCTLERGKRYALVGSSGSGKSTLLTLLAGLEAQTCGDIQCDGVSLTIAELRALATLVPQGVQLFEGTLAENISMGSSSRSEHMLVALEVACAREFTVAQTTDLTTPIDEGGKNWSGGQRQRIALARGVLAARGGTLLLLDEPGASLDAATERRLLTQLFAAFPDACIVVSIHRLHLLDLFDAAIVVENGCISDSGNAEDLSLRSPIFRQLADTAYLDVSAM